MPRRSLEPPYRPQIVRGREHPLASLTGDEARASIDQSSPGQRALKMWLDECLESGVRIPNPAHIGCHVEWRAQGLPLLVGHQNAQLARDQLRAEIVWVAAECGATGTATLKERSQIS